MALSEYRLLLIDRLRDTANLVRPDAQDRALVTAVKRYSRVRPRERVQTITGTGSAITFALAADFEEGVSRVKAIEYPVDQQEPEYLDEDEFALYRDPTTGVVGLRMLDLKLSLGTKAYVTYTIRHSVDDKGNDTIPVADRDAVAGLGAAMCLRDLAAHYAQTSNPTVGADSVDYGSKSRDYLALAKELEAQAEAQVPGISDADMVAASATGDLDVDWGPGFAPRFYHGQRSR